MVRGTRALTRWRPALLALAFLAACAKGPEPIRWGVDVCAQCRMILDDRRFGAELVDARGRVATFDGVDELARYLASHPTGGTAYVTDGDTGLLIGADSAVYLAAANLQSPMGGDVMSFRDRAQAEAYARAHGLRELQWLTYGQVLQRWSGRSDR